MENASKALLIAGGVILAMLVIALLIFAWGIFSDYYSSKDGLKDIKDVAKFNEQFEQYNRDDIMGYELVSLANKVADYNKEHTSSDSEANNSESFDPINLTISFVNTNNLNKFVYDENVSYNHLFKNTEIKTDTMKTRNSIKQILETVYLTEGLYSSSDDAAKVSKAILSIDPEKVAENLFQESLTDLKKDISEEGKEKVKLVYENCTDSFNAVTRKKYDENDFKSFWETNKEKIYQYYEYYMFKRAVFKCTEIKYDDSKFGRISSMKYEFTGKIE